VSMLGRPRRSRHGVGILLFVVPLILRAFNDGSTEKVLIFWISEEGEFCVFFLETYYVVYNYIWDGMCSMYEAWNALQTLVPSLLTSTRLTSSKGLLSTPHHSNTVTVAGSVIHYSFCVANLSLSSRNILSNLIVWSRFACPRDVFCLGNVRPDT
jgi:hypothetical protein